MRIVFYSIVVAFGIFIVFFIASLFMTGCNKIVATHMADGWYPVADYPDNTVVGKPLFPVKDFDKLVLQRETRAVFY